MATSKNSARTRWICSKAVTLERCKIDEQGKAVHEGCYTVKIPPPGLPHPDLTPGQQRTFIADVKRLFDKK